MRRTDTNNMIIKRDYNYARLKIAHRKHEKNDYLVTRIKKDENPETNQRGQWYYKHSKGPTETFVAKVADPVEYWKS